MGWVLSDAEIATYLMLRYRLQRSTRRSADTLYRLAVADKMSATGRTFRTGKGSVGGTWLAIGTAA